MSNKLYKILIILGIVAALMAIPAFWFTYSAPNKLEVSFLDIGQGDATLIETPMGQNILIDGGPDNAVLKRLSEELSWWERTIDLMILTHPHDDHVNGLNDVIKRYRIKRILYTGAVHNSPGYLNWLELIRENRIPMTIIDRPQTIKLGKDCELRILYPLKSFLGEEVDNLNNSSIVARLDYGETSFLFTGDAEIETEEELLAAYNNDKEDEDSRRLGHTLKNFNTTPEGAVTAGAAKYGAPKNKSDSGYARSGFTALRGHGTNLVLKAGHHGSDTSSGIEFLKTLNPDIVVIQVGADNTFGHPSRRILKRLERLGAAVYRNDFDGTVRIVSDGREVFVEGGK